MEVSIKAKKATFGPALLSNVTITAGGLSMDPKDTVRNRPAIILTVLREFMQFY